MAGIDRVKPSQLLAEILLLAATCLYLYPLYVVIILAAKSAKDALFNPLGWPSTIQWSNFTEAYRLMDFGQVFVNSLIITLASSVGIACLPGWRPSPSQSARAGFTPPRIT
jgi:raffinose/stachyose/melibiose transport system permease protein